MCPACRSQTQGHHVNCYLNFQPAGLLYKCQTCQSLQLCEPIPGNESVSHSHSCPLSDPLVPFLSRTHTNKADNAMNRNSSPGHVFRLRLQSSPACKHCHLRDIFSWNIYCHFKYSLSRMNSNHCLVSTEYEQYLMKKNRHICCQIKMKEYNRVHWLLH